jgi:hypothetical protein
MSKSAALGAVALAAAALAGCSGSSKPGGSDGGSCASGTVAQVEATCHCTGVPDCKSGNSSVNWACTPAHSCIQICTSSSDCQSPSVCEDLICRPPACGDDSECNSGQQCIGGSCTAALAASNVASCSVLPPNAVINATGTKAFWVVAYDSTGAAIPYGTLSSQAITWAATGISASTSATTPSVTFTGNSTAAAGAATTSGSVTATIGSTSCAASTVKQYAPVASGSVRVVAVVLGDDTPISGASVTLDNGTAQTTAADGSATFTSVASGPHDISVFQTGYTYVTIMQTSATDVLVPLKATPNPGNFQGTLTDTNFNNVSDPSGNLHLDISGASIPGNLIDLSLSTLLGAGRPYTINLGTATTYNISSLPEGIALGLGPSMFGNGQYGIEPAPGVRALFAIGGNAVIGTVLQAVGPALSGGTGSISSMIPSILAAILPIVGSLESGVTSGVVVMPGESATLTYGTTPQPALQLDTLMRLKLNVATPNLPSYTDDTGAMVAFDGAVVLGGVLDTPQGFVPLGLTAGVDQVTAAGAMTPDGITDPIAATMTTPAFAAGHLPLRVAPRHGGVETAPWAFVTLGASLSGLFGSLGSSGSGSSGTILAGTINFAPNKLVYTNPTYYNAADLSKPFLPVPNGAAYNPAATSSTATFTPPSATAGAAFHRLDLSAKDSKGDSVDTWWIFFPASMDGAAAVTLPTPPNGLANNGTASGTSAILQSVSLGYNPPGAEGALSYDGAVQFDGVDLDDLTLETDTFSVRALPAPASGG